MTDASPSTPLTDQALSRLKKLADGNGLPPDAIRLMGTEEQVYALEGTMRLMPLCDAQSGRYMGGVRGRGRQVLPDIATLHSEAERRQKEFKSGSVWITAAMEQLKQQPAEGWGLNDIQIALPDLSVVLAASAPCPACGGRKMQTCPQCGGQGTAVCTYCHGQRQEFCYNCSGRGVNPLHPDQRCPICNGTRYIPCRFCRASGQMACPMCHGRRGTTCATCNGAGLMTEEIAITCGAHTHFTIKGEGMPSGLRRGLDRIGLGNLMKGFADIEVVAPEPEKPDPSPEGAFPHAPPSMPPRDAEEAPPDDRAKPPSPEIHYRAQLPYADMRMDFNGKKALVNVFGKRGMLMGVPPFLDAALEPWRAKLKKAARGGEGSMDDALGVRAMQDALKLQIAGTARIEAFRKIYPFGLSPEAMQDILGGMRLALNRLTLRTRAVTALLGAVIAAAIFGGFFLTPFHAHMMQSWPWQAGLAFDLALPTLVMGLGWLALSASAQFVLRRRFPDLKIPVFQKTGKTGYALLAAMGALYIAVLLSAPLKPVWFLYLTHG